ncbi:hypothetical protein CICLE_v10005897mg [Citrus x clementina]|uniref:Embryo-specific protein ATS3A n=1 Tax=Citrus clementina TaxID=85681 RepID=V4U6Y1_CITCL|nr:embryo-specific protein ATS3B [Citrus x clementina]ESR35014.1 hypothetical protein CICLE_v10005897mg [Citrus x clementina]
MKIKLAAHFLLLLAFSAFMLSEAETQLKPHAIESFTVNYIQKFGNCTYLVVIKTSCDSKNFTRDRISIAFGDAYGNQIYAPRLDDPFTKTFQSCSSDGFQIDGPCATDICYVYLHRSGLDGWEPESVKIISPNSSPVTYDFNTSAPNEDWYGVNLCQIHPPPSPFEPSPPFPFKPPPSPPSSSHQHRVPGLFGLVMILGSILSALL